MYRITVFFQFTLTLLIPDISCYENNIDPDLQAPEKQADLDLYCYPFYMEVHANTVFDLKSALCENLFQTFIPFLNSVDQDQLSSDAA